MRGTSNLWELVLAWIFLVLVFSPFPHRIITFYEQFVNIVFTIIFTIFASMLLSDFISANTEAQG